MDGADGVVVLRRKRILNDEDIPSAIRALRPSYVAVSTNHVLICLSAFPRMYVLGFSANSEQYGTDRLIDGLWYYTGRKVAGNSQREQP